MNKLFLFTACGIFSIAQLFAQNVGIGTNTPQTKLDINGALSARVSSLAAAASVTIPDNVTLFRLTKTAGGSNTALAVTTPKDGQFLTVINEDDNTATLNGYTILAGTAANPAVANFIYVGTGANPGWKVSGDNTPSGTGPQGPAGPQGPQGVAGADGATGPTGAKGATGAAGSNGTKGATGPTGPTGADGAKGATGAAGSNGTKGATGPTGPTGADGAKGATGAAGAAGTKGATGPTGPTGADGAKGATGAAGSNGTKGATGPTGATGFLGAGTAAGNTTYWNGTTWVLNSANIYNNGSNVGIGTTIPDALFSIGANGSGSAGTTGGNQLLLGGAYNTGVNVGGKKLYITNYDNDGATVYPIYIDDENNFVDFWIMNRLSQAGLPTMYFAGNTGIGITSPSSILDIGSTSDAVTDTKALTVNSNGYAGIYLKGDLSNGSGEPGGSFVSFAQDNGGVEGIIGEINTAGTDGSGRTFAGTSGNSMLVGNKYNGSLHFGTNNTVRMTIANSGGVTINDLAGNGTRQVFADNSGKLITGTTNSSIHSVKQTTDISTASSAFSDMGSLALTFTPSHSTVYVFFSAGVDVSNFTQAWGAFRVLKGSTSVAGTNVVLEDFDEDHYGDFYQASAANPAINGIPVSVTVGVSTTFKVQWRISRLWGSASMVCYPSSVPDNAHAVLTIME